MTAATLIRPPARRQDCPPARPQSLPARPQSLGAARTGGPQFVRKPLCPRGPAVPRVRVTRRGRLVLVVAAAALLLVAISLGRTGSQAATSTETGPALQQMTVQQGETLWSVAQRIAPGNDPREVIAKIRRINHLQSSSLQAGQQLLLPTAG